MVLAARLLDQIVSGSGVSGQSSLDTRRAHNFIEVGDNVRGVVMRTEIDLTKELDEWSSEYVGGTNQIFNSSWSDSLHNKHTWLSRTLVFQSQYLHSVDTDERDGSHFRTILRQDNAGSFRLDAVFSDGVTDTVVVVLALEADFGFARFVKWVLNASLPHRSVHGDVCGAVWWQPSRPEWINIGMDHLSVEVGASREFLGGGLH